MSAIKTKHPSSKLEIGTQVPYHYKCALKHREASIDTIEDSSQRKSSIG